MAKQLQSCCWPSKFLVNCFEAQMIRFIAICTAGKGVNDYLCRIKQGAHSG